MANERKRRRKGHDEPVLNDHPSSTSSDICSICKVDFYSENDITCVQCDYCNTWYHTKCAGIPDSDVSNLPNLSNWFCHNCAGIPDHQPATALTACWGALKGQEIEEELLKAYSEIVSWRPNLFKLPKGSPGRSFVSEVDRLANAWANKSDLEQVAMLAIHIIGALLLQNPGRKSTPKENKAALTRRLDLWKRGSFSELLAEAREIQKRLSKIGSDNESISRGFSRLMFKGRVGSAMRLISKAQSAPLDVSPELIAALEAKHPPDGPLNRTHLFSSEPAPKFEHVIFDAIGGGDIKKAAKSTRGGCGPSGMTDDLWTRMLCSRAFAQEGDNLSNTLARVTRRLCTDLVDPSTISSLVACRLIGLNKNPGVRPIGVGEILRRIVGRTVTQFLKSDIIKAAGPLQLAAGQEGGCEAAIHAMNSYWEQDECEGILCADASNAFNSLNRKTSLVNIRFLCPEFSIFLIDIYRLPSKLFLYNGKYVMSREGTTQGDNAAAPFYSISLYPLMNDLSSIVEFQLFYADDGAGAGHIDNLKRWWDKLCERGPGYGYFPNGAKSILLVKPQHLSRAQEVFDGTGVVVTVEGVRYLGSPIGTPEFKATFVSEKVNEWCSQVELLSTIALCEPQCAYSGFSFGLSKKWLFLMRTTSEISTLFDHLEETISSSFLPALLGPNIPQHLRSVLSLPARDGGLGIHITPSQAEAEFCNSVQATAPLKELILEQRLSIDDERAGRFLSDSKKAKSEVVKRKRKIQSAEKESTRGTIPENERRLFDEISSRGASSWLTSLPLKEHGFVLNKQQFHDALLLRYNLPFQNIPLNCACGKPNSLEHCLSCALGGYVYMRHNNIRDLTANILLEAGCKDVEIEPQLLPISGETFNYRSTITENSARLDVSARGVWSPLDKVFTDIRVFNSLAPTNNRQSVDDTFRRHEREKILNYNDRVLQVEKATFTPLVFSTTGLMGPKAEVFYKRAATLLSKKTGHTYNDSIRYIRLRLCFCLLKTILISIRGYRGNCFTRFNSYDNDFNLII